RGSITPKSFGRGLRGNTRIAPIARHPRLARAVLMVGQQRLVSAYFLAVLRVFPRSFSGDEAGSAGY
ncbi:MAG TPA: hypothetical protein VJN95_11980, partial [Gemmatimonadales bacterium]|nr:hypothetical protein [Gemmatimonadales bacterium]